MLQSIPFGAAIAIVLGLGLGAAQADVVRCEVTDSNSKLMAEWIEYEINAYGTAVAVRDSLGASRGIDWVPGEIIDNTARRLTLTWDIGALPQQQGWRTGGRILMRLARLPDGSVRITGTPTTIVADGAIYSGKATCSS